GGNGEWEVGMSLAEPIRYSLFTIRLLPDRKRPWLRASRYRPGESLSARLAPDLWAQDRDGRAPDRNRKPSISAMTDARDYSATLFLPQTDFPMRAGLPQKEPELLERWRRLDIYRRLRRAAAGK